MICPTCSSDNTRPGQGGKEPVGSQVCLACGHIADWPTFKGDPKTRQEHRMAALTELTRLTEEMGGYERERALDLKGDRLKVAKLRGVGYSALMVMQKTYDAFKTVDPDGLLQGLMVDLQDEIADLKKVIEETAD